MKSPCEGAAHDARLNPHIIPVRGKDVVRKCNPPIPYKP